VTIARHLGEDQPFYALRARGLDGTEEPWDDLTAMATDYISHLRTVQPTGPYYIGGHSLGVGIAFEMAQQLTEAGESVALVALLDDTLFALDDRSSLLQLDTLLFYLRNVRTVVRRLVSRPEAWRAALARIAEGVLNRPRLFDRARLAAGRHHSERMASIQAAQYRAWMAYRPWVYPGRLTLFRSEDQPISRMRDVTMGWGRVAAGGVEIRPVGGTHDTLTREPYIRELAAQLKASLTAARDAADSMPADAAMLSAAPA
jgi:thioesterase domain-containing protein